jgi:hypothetical protein
MTDQLGNLLLEGCKDDITPVASDGSQTWVCWAMSGSVDFSIMCDILDYGYFVGFVLEVAIAYIRLYLPLL